MKIKIRIDGETPAKKNSRIFSFKLKRSFPSSRYTKWHKTAVESIRKQTVHTFEGPVMIEVTFVHGDNRRRDSDNGLSSILDTLVDSKVLKDDSWQIVQEVRILNEYSKGESYCDIYVQDL